MKYIFEGIIETDQVLIKIDAVSETDDDREYLTTLVKDTLHHKIVDLILDELDEEKRLFFIAHLDDESKHLTLLSKLSEWIKDFEYKVVTTAKNAEKELLELIERALADE
jgi:hypothetical protein